MLPIEDQLTILNSDTQIIDNTRRLDNGDGTIRLRIGGDLFVDGNECTMIVQAPLNLQGLQAWCQYVRGEWNERKNREEAEAARKEEARRIAEAKETADAATRGGSTVSVENSAEVGEETLEATLRAKIALLDRARSWWQDAATSARTRYTECESQLKRIDREHRVALGLLRTYIEEMKDDSSENSPQDSFELSEDTE